MHGAVGHAPREVRLEDQDDPETRTPTDALLRIWATPVCGSDGGGFRGTHPIDGPTLEGQERCGAFVED
jgi:threonine dehydrogenase-like Zn-dependent dehydrogenase